MMTMDRYNNVDDENCYSDEERSSYRLKTEKTTNVKLEGKFLDNKLRDCPIEEDEGPPYFIQLCGLPYTVKVQEILSFLTGCNVVDGAKGVEITTGPNLRTNGYAFVELRSMDDVMHALSKDREHIGPRYIEVRRISLPTIRKLQDKWKPRRNPVNAVVCLKGLPYNCTTDDIRDFFKGLEIEDNGVLIILDEKGRVCGEGFVHFKSLRDVELALRQHKLRIRHRYIEVYRSDLREMYPRSQLSSNSSGLSNQNTNAFLLDFVNQINSYSSFFNQQDIFPNSDPHRKSRDERYDNYNRPGPMRGRDDVDKYNRRAPYERRSPDRFRRPDSRRSPSPFRNRRAHYRHKEYIPPYRSKTGCSVHMRGLPYSVTKEQIIDFFSPIIPVEIALETLSSGLRTGNANVDFTSDEDVREALKKDREMIESRYIELYNNKGRH